ncbi:MAG: sulfotransferase [Sphingomonadaceae bacterium]|nr:sulfotransferase [Sphingomonadaceae bacterium]
MTMLTADAVIARAREATSYSGECDASLREGLEVTLAAFAAAPMTAEAKASVSETIVNDLIMRFRIEDFLSRNPEIEEQEIKGPLLVTSVPRSGTTATLAMLGLDPRFRYTRDWELREPLPPPVFGEEDRDPRAIAARERSAMMDQSIHLYDPDGPEEDLVAIAGYDMRQFHARYPMRQEYLDWYIADDFRSVYRLHERLLKLLQWRRPPNFWLLKAPPHLLRFEAFAERYPDSRIIMTHREPTKTIPSIASMYDMLYNMVCEPGTVDKAWIGRRCLEFWSRGMQIAMRARDKLGEDRFLDVYNRDLVADPIGTFEQLYDQLGFKIDAKLRVRLEDYHQRNAKGAHGTHSYSLEEYGLSEKKINEAFSEYRDRFGI